MQVIMRCHARNYEILTTMICAMQAVRVYLDMQREKNWARKTSEAYFQAKQTEFARTNTSINKL